MDTRLYLDHNASTPVRPEVAEAMLAALVHLHGNPSSLHREGQRARAAVERAREQVAALVAARPEEVVFTSGGTEADHLGVAGLAWAAVPGPRVAVSAVEHHAVHGAGELLESRGGAVDHLPVGRDGRIDARALEIRPGTAVVAVMLANNETGVLQPVAEVAAAAHAAGARLHCDAVQAAGKVPVDVGTLTVDTLAISGHKLGGPKGAGALIVLAGAAPAPLFRGSGHERGRRGGTENLPGIVGLGLAAELAARDLSAESARLLALRRRLEEGLLALAPDAVIHGADAPRLPNTALVSFPGARSDHLLMALDARGVAVSAGAACASGAVEPSAVLAAMGVPRAIAICAVRFSLGRTSNADEVERALRALGEALPAARAAGAGAAAATPA